MTSNSKWISYVADNLFDGADPSDGVLIALQKAFKAGYDARQSENAQICKEFFNCEYIKDLCEHCTYFDKTHKRTCIHGDPGKDDDMKKIGILLKALALIADYGDNNGICPYGCDTPNIASEALKEYNAQSRVIERLTHWKYP